MKLRDLTKLIKEDFAAHGIDDVSEAEFLVAVRLNKNRSAVYSNDDLTKNQVRLVIKWAKKRIKGIPLSEISHNQNFYGRDFFVNKNCLTPRPETEELVLLVSKNEKDKRVLDLCSGSGAIAITLNLEFGFNCVASDISAKALKVAKINAKKLGANVKFVKSNLFNKINEKFDIIVSNPPYVTSEEYEVIDKVVKNYDPKISLLAGENGLYFYRKIILDAPKYLNKGGKIYFEIGESQASAVSSLLEKDFEDINVIKDLEGKDRMVCAKLKEKL